MAEASATGKEMLVAIILIAITFAIVLALAATFNNTSVSSNFVAAAVSASSLLGVILFVAMAAIVLKLTGKL